MQHIRNLVSKCLEKKQYLIFFILCKASSFAWAYRSISIKTNFELDLQSWRKSAILCFILTKASVAEGFQPWFVFQTVTNRNRMSRKKLAKCLQFSSQASGRLEKGSLYSIADGALQMAILSFLYCTTAVLNFKVKENFQVFVFSIGQYKEPKPPIGGSLYCHQAARIVTHSPVICFGIAACS